MNTVIKEVIEPSQIESVERPPSPMDGLDPSSTDQLVEVLARIYLHHLKAMKEGRAPFSLDEQLSDETKDQQSDNEKASHVIKSLGQHNG